MGYLLALESSCDESAAAVIEMETGRPAAAVVYSQIDLHRRYGGVVPEIASRDHLRRMPGVVEEAMQEAAIGWDSIEVVAATRGPGLATSLLVGWTMAKGIAAALGVPVVGVNHLVGHLASLGLSPDMPDGSMSLPDPLTSCGPTVILLVSGGHTALVLNQGLHDRRLLGQTIDDAAGEAYDKVAKIRWHRPAIRRPFGSPGVFSMARPPTNIDTTSASADLRQRCCIRSVVIQSAFSRAERPPPR